MKPRPQTSRSFNPHECVEKIGEPGDEAMLYVLKVPNDSIHLLSPIILLC